MLPAAVVLGLTKTSLIADPALAFAPVIEPVLVPNVHAKLLATSAVSAMLGLVPLHVLAVVAVVN